MTSLPWFPKLKMVTRYRNKSYLRAKFRFIFFTKDLMNRLNDVSGDVILPILTAFVKQRCIMEGVMILHLALNNNHIKTQSDVIFKVDFEKAYLKSSGLLFDKC